MAVLRVGDTRRAASRGLRSLASPSGLRGAGREVAWLAAHAALYPLGVRAEPPCDPSGPHRVDDVPPEHRALLMHGAAATTPILLVHGVVDNRSIFTLLRRSLRRCGFGQVRTVNYSVFTSDVRAAAAALGEAVEQACAQTGHERVHVVAHSMGGVVARYYVQRMGGDERVHTLVTLGSPHGGTDLARLVPMKLSRQLRPGSELLAELAEPAPGCRTRFLALWSDLDQLIYPKRNARIDHPDLHAHNVMLRGVGHMSLPIDRRAARMVARALAHLGPDGSPTAGD